MKVDKRYAYIKKIMSAIHTMELSVDEAMAIDKVLEDLIEQVNHVGRSHGKLHFRINPNKGVEGNAMNKGFSEVEELLLEILSLCCLDETDVNLFRCDIAIDTADKGDFELYKKLHRLICCCVSVVQGLTNCYDSTDLWTFASLSMACKNRSYEIENYNKEIESKGLVPTTNRLELRRKGLKNSADKVTEAIKKTFLDDWSNVLERAKQKEIFEEVQQLYNKNLSVLYLDDQSKPKKDQRFQSVTHFILDYKDSIFTKKQLVELLTMIGCPSPENKATRLKERHNIEFYSLTDLQVVIDAIKKEIKDYF